MALQCLISGLRYEGEKRGLEIPGPGQVLFLMQALALEGIRKGICTSLAVHESQMRQMQSLTSFPELLLSTEPNPEGPGFPREPPSNS